MEQEDIECRGQKTVMKFLVAWGQKDDILKNRMIKGSFYEKGGNCDEYGFFI